MRFCVFLLKSAEGFRRVLAGVSLRLCLFTRFYLSDLSMF